MRNTLFAVHGCLPARRIEDPNPGRFEPVTGPKHVRRLAGLEANVIRLYAKGLTTGEIQARLHEIHGIDVSREPTSKITDAILPDMLAGGN